MKQMKKSLLCLFVPVELKNSIHFTLSQRPYSAAKEDCECFF